MNKKDRQRINEIFDKRIRLMTELAGELALEQCYSETDNTKEINDIFWEIDGLYSLKEQILEE
jgi:hypothetical protein